MILKNISETLNVRELTSSHGHRSLRRGHAVVIYPVPTDRGPADELAVRVD